MPLKRVPSLARPSSEPFASRRGVGAGGHRACALLTVAVGLLGCGVKAVTISCGGWRGERAGRRSGRSAGTVSAARIVSCASRWGKLASVPVTVSRERVWAGGVIFSSRTGWVARAEPSATRGSVSMVSVAMWPAPGPVSVATSRSGDGVCAPVQAGAPDPHGVCLNELPASCGQTGACNGQGGCARHLAGTVCRPPSCQGRDAFVPASLCDGDGTCVVGMGVSV